jgi:hypothetical protein
MLPLVKGVMVDYHTKQKTNISRDEEICIKYIKRLLSLQLFID